jgi:hypothetical protein
MHGPLVQAGYINSAAFGTAWADATTKIPIVKESFTKEFERTSSKALTGSAAEKEFFNGRVIVGGDLEMNLDFDTNGLLEHCMGNKAGGTHTLTNVLDKWFHFQVDKYTIRHRVQSVFADGFTISGEKGSSDPVAWVVKGHAYDYTRSATAFPTLTLTEKPVRFEHLTQCWLGDQTDALAVGDAIAISAFEIAVEHNQEVDGGDSSDHAHVLAQARNGLRTVTLKLTLPRLNASAETISTWRDAGTRLQAILKFDSGAGADTIQFNFPDIKIEGGGDFNVDGASVLKSEITLRAFANLHNTPMAAVTDQFNVVVV